MGPFPQIIRSNKPAKTPAQDSHLTPGNGVQIIGKVNADLSIKVLSSMDLGTEVGEFRPPFTPPAYPVARPSWAQQAINPSSREPIQSDHCRVTSEFLTRKFPQTTTWPTQSSRSRTNIGASSPDGLEFISQAKYTPNHQPNKTALLHFPPHGVRGPMLFAASTQDTNVRIQHALPR